MKKPRGHPRGGGTKKKSGKFHETHDVYDFHDLPLIATIIADDDIGAALAEPALPAATKISYTLDIYSISQMKKLTKSRGDPKCSVMVMNSDEPWDTFKAQALTRIEKVLKPPTISFDNYKVTFMVPRLQKTTDLEDEQSYGFMVGRATCSSDPTAIICIEPLIPEGVSCTTRLIIHCLHTHVFTQLSDSDKENKDKNSDSGSSESGSEDEGHKRKGKKKKGKGKSKSKKVCLCLALGYKAPPLIIVALQVDPSDLPGNKAIALKIGELRQTWACNTPSCENTHYTLLNRWASAIVCNL